MIEYLCDGRVNVVETINGANIYCHSIGQRKKLKAETFFCRDKKNTVSLPENIHDENTDKSGHLKKGNPKKVHLANILLLLRKIRSENFIYFVDKAWRCGLVGSGYKSGC